MSDIEKELIDRMLLVKKIEKLYAENAVLREVLKKAQDIFGASQWFEDGIYDEIGCTLSTPNAKAEAMLELVEAAVRYVEEYGDHLMQTDMDGTHLVEVAFCQAVNKYKEVE
jgi:hypothetical protein